MSMSMYESKVHALPIDHYREEIMSSNSSYIIVEAETGSGKSTQVPQWFCREGYRVLVTEPVIETVIGTSEYVAQQMNVEHGSTVGYRIGQSSKVSNDTRILFCTDGLALVRELSNQNRFDVLIIDELHEWNTNQSTLEAWAWKHLVDGTSSFKKIIVLSATIDSETLAVKRGNAPVFKIPGRQFPISDRHAGTSIDDDIRKLVDCHNDVLVFLPGEREILETISKLNGINAELIPFYSKLDRKDKDRAYKNYDRPKVVISTNALETGRTLLPSPGRELAVIDSGMERRIELVNGIEILRLAPIAKARSKQRRGRTGRVGKGIYIDHCPEESRPEFPTPEILRTRLDQTVLRLACAGYDATELPFFHQLDTDVIEESKSSLYALGALTANNKVTDIGKLMSRLPINVQYARMIVEATKRNVTEEVITVASILEVGGIRDRSGKWRELTKESKSDLVAELDIFRSAKLRKKEELREMGISPQAYYKAVELKKKLREALLQQGVAFNKTQNRQDQNILKSCIAGMVNHLYKCVGSDQYKNGSEVIRQKAKESVVLCNPSLIVGIPKSISGISKRGNSFMINIVMMISEVDSNLLAEVAPQLISTEVGITPYFDSIKDSVVSTTRKHFNGQVISEDKVVDMNHPEANNIFCEWLVSQTLLHLTTDHEKIISITKANIDHLDNAMRLNRRIGQVLYEEFTPKTLAVFYKARTKSAVNICSIKDINSLILPPLDQSEVIQILSDYPDDILVNDKLTKIEYIRDYSYSSIKYSAIISIDPDTVLNLSCAPTIPSMRPLLIRSICDGKLIESIDLDIVKNDIKKHQTNLASD